MFLIFIILHSQYVYLLFISAIVILFTINISFHYSVFYVFYEQYLTISHDTWVDLTICASKYNLCFYKQYGSELPNC